MKRIFVIVGLLVGLASGVAQAQTRVGVAVSFGDPYFNGQVVIGQPYYHRAPVVVVAPRYHAEPRVVVVKPHRKHRRYHRGW